MESAESRGWMRLYVLPSIAMIVAVVLSVLLTDESISGFVAMVACWVLAFVFGYFLRPPHSWIPALVLVLAGVVASNVAAAIGDYDPPGSIWVFTGGILLAGIPLMFLQWIGKEVSLIREDFKPHAPAQ